MSKQETSGCGGLIYAGLLMGLLVTLAWGAAHYWPR